jgi:hypothetical protein
MSARSGRAKAVIGVAVVGMITTGVIALFCAVISILRDDLSEAAIALIPAALSFGILSWRPLSE